MLLLLLWVSFLLTRTHTQVCAFFPPDDVPAILEAFRSGDDNRGHLVLDAMNKEADNTAHGTTMERAAAHVTKALDLLVAVESGDLVDPVFVTFEPDDHIMVYSAKEPPVLAYHPSHKKQ